LLVVAFGGGGVRIFPKDLNQIPRDSYIYLGTLNVKKEKVVTSFGIGEGWGYMSLGNIADDRNKIYDNGGAYVSR